MVGRFLSLGMVRPPLDMPSGGDLQMLFLLTYYCLVVWLAAVFLYKDGFIHSRTEAALAPLAPIYLTTRYAIDRKWRKRW